MTQSIEMPVVTRPESGVTPHQLLYGTTPRMRSLGRNFLELMSTLFEQDGRTYQPWPWTWQPPCSLYLEDDNIVFECELPGVSRDRLDVHVNQDTILITGERMPTREEREASILLQEQRFGKFHRIVPLPYPVRSDNVEAHLKNGVLRITLPMLDPEKARGVKVAVK